VVLVAFVPIFFTNTGLNTKIGSLETPLAWFACGLVLIAAVAGKLGGCFLGARATGSPMRDAGCIAALMNTRALMGLIAINVGLELKLLNSALFTMLVIMALVTTAMCGPLLRWWLPDDLKALLPGYSSEPKGKIPAVTTK
jgi:Kef-type K+ transport system membrane component KefB